MSVSASELLKLKQQVKELDEQRIRAEANYDQALSQLQELGYDTIEDAEQALKDMRASIEEEEAKLAEDMDALLDKYPELN